MSEKLLEDFGARLRALREKRNLSQAELANKGGFNRNYIGIEISPEYVDLITSKLGQQNEYV